PWQLLTDAGDGLDHIGAGLTLDVDHDRRAALVPAADLVILQSVDDLGDVLEHHRGAVTVGDHDVAIALRGHQLVVAGDAVALVGAVERALGPGGIRSDDRKPHILEADPVIRKPRQIDLDANGRLDAALNRDAADAGDLAQPLGEHG